MIERKEAKDWRERIEKNIERWWRVLETRAKNSANPINPQRVFWELSAQLPNEAILTADSGSAADWYARDVKLRRGMMASLSGGLATMGPGVPYAIAAKLAHPERTVIATVGDGAMLMNGINGLITIAHLWREWSNPRLVVMVLNNGDLNQVTWEQRVMEGDPKFSPSQDVPRFAYAEYARLLGLIGIRVDDAEAVADAWSQAFSADRPVVLEMITDPNVPPLPPHISLKDVRNYLRALWHRDPDALALIKATMKESWAGRFPEKGD
jgi:pyruvate dehydrogenase (quinone)